MIELKHYIGEGLKVKSPLNEVWEMVAITQRALDQSFEIAVDVWVIDGDDLIHDGNYFLKEAEFKPLMLPLSALTEKIKVEGYNDGREFVPVMELFDRLDELGNPMFQKYEAFDGITITATYKMLGEPFTDFVVNRGSVEDVDFWIVQKLISWHFWIGDQSLFGEQIIDKRTV